MRPVFLRLTTAMQATVERISEALNADKLDEAQQLLKAAPPDALSSAEKHLCGRGRAGRY